MLQYGKIPSEEYSIEAIQNAYRHGCTFFDTAEVYSPNLSGIGHDELIVGKALDDVRNWVPQLSRRNIESNMPIVEMLREFANKKNATPAQISLAWMLHKYPNVVPIPGSKNKERIIENQTASQVELTDDEFTALETELNKCKVYVTEGLAVFLNHYHKTKKSSQPKL